MKSRIALIVAVTLLGTGCVEVSDFLQDTLGSSLKTNVQTVVETAISTTTETVTASVLDQVLGVLAPALPEQVLTATTAE